MEAPQLQGRDHMMHDHGELMINTNIFHGESQLRDCTSNSGEQDDLVQVIADTLLSRCPAVTKVMVDACFKAANTAVRQMDQLTFMASILSHVLMAPLAGLGCSLSRPLF